MIETRPILFAPANENQARIYSIVAQELRAQGLPIHFLTFDSIYGQSAERALISKQLPSSPFIATIGGEWCDYSDEERAEILAPLTPSLLRLLKHLNPNVLVISNDTGSAEQILMRAAQAMGAKVVFLQDGLLELPKSIRSGRHSHPPIGALGADHLCVWSEAVAEQLRTLGVRSPITVTGNPIYDTVSTSNSPLPGPPFNVLLAHQCFGRYGVMSVFEEVAFFERLIGHILSRPDTTLTFKLHPQSTLFSRYQELESQYPERLTVVRHGSSFDQIIRSHAVITISSTVALEGHLLGVPTLSLSDYVVDSIASLKTEERFLTALQSEHFPQSFSEGAQTAMDRWHRPQDGNCTKRVCEIITSLHQRSFVSRNPCADALTAFVIFLSGELESEHWVWHLGFIPSRIVLMGSAVSDPVIERLRRHYPQTAITAFSQGSSFAPASELLDTDYVIAISGDMAPFPQAFECLIESLSSAPEMEFSSGLLAIRDATGSVIGVEHSPLAPGSSSRENPRPLLHKNSDLFAIRWPCVRSRDEHLNFSSIDELRSSVLSCNLGPGVSVPSIIGASAWRMPWGMPAAASVSVSTSGPLTTAILLPRDLSASLLRSMAQALNDCTLSSEMGRIAVRGGLPSDLSMADARRLFRSDRYALDLFPHARPQELERRALETSTADLWALLAPGVIPSTAWLDAFLRAVQSKVTNGLFWVGHTTVHPSQSQTIFGHALAGIDIRSTFGPLSGQSAPLSCWLPGYNHLIPRTLLEHLLADPRYEGSHSEDILWGDIILKLGMTPEWVPDARAQYSATISVSSFIQRERQLGIQFAALFRSTFHPDLPMQLFGLREMDHGQILEMKSVAPSVRGQLDQLVRSLDGLEHTPVNNDSEDAKANSAVLIHEVAGVLRILAQQTRVLGFLDSL